ncbi:toxin VasX [Pseudomonas sp.]|jgi:hypothetical protein|uniref:toxin VasX n=1 Tax=Pseudomonas sp. TaxID=306 RepID=UPI002E3311CB|nr:toxin VasX [Pseudomonas sp.]HEX4550304.1 toxin VasX [Pseudomonas sp.]
MTQAATEKLAMKPAACPLITAVVPLRYAIGPSHAIDVSAFDLPPLNGKFPELGEKNEVTRDKALNYTARLLRDGWLYVWQSSPEKLIEFSVKSAMLQETARGGKVLDASSKPYLMLPAGTPAMISWSPSKWSDNQFSAAKGEAKVRTRVMRNFTPGAAPASGKAASIHESIGDYMEPIGFNWSCAPETKNKPNWSSMLDEMKRCEQQAYVITDDPWGVWIDLAGLIRIQHDEYETRRKIRAHDWSVAGVLKSLSDNDPQIKSLLPTITRYRDLKTAWAELDKEEEEYSKSRRILSLLWNDWMNTFQRKGPSTLDTAAGQFEIKDRIARGDLEAHFAAACLGPSSCSLSAKALAKALDPNKQEAGQPWLIWAMLGLGRRMAVADMKSLVDLGDGIKDNAGPISKEAAKFGRALALATIINKTAENLSALNPEQVKEALFIALAPAIAPSFHAGANNIDDAGKLFAASALGRSGQSLKVTEASHRQIGEWLTTLMEGDSPTSKPNKPPTLPTELENKLPFFSLSPASTAKPSEKLGSIAHLVSPENEPKNLLSINKTTLKKAPIKCLVTLTAAINFGWAVKDFISTPTAKSGLNVIGGGTGVISAASAVTQKIAELNWESLLKEAAPDSVNSRLLLTQAVGQATKTTLLQAIVSSFDIAVYGIEAFEAYTATDYDTAAINAGLSVASAANLSIYVKTFRVLRAARAAVIVGDAATIGRGVSQAPHLAFKALGVTILIVGGVIARLYTQDTPLEKWVKGTSFGVNPDTWATSYKDTMIQLYKILFPISFDAYRLSELNPYKGMVESTYLILRMPGKTAIEDSTIRFEGEEVWGGIFGLGSKREKVSWTGSSFDKHTGTRVSTEPGVATYRRVYHLDREGRAINNINGQLFYSPLEGMTLPPIEIKELAWF